MAQGNRAHRRGGWCGRESPGRLRVTGWLRALEIPHAERGAEAEDRRAAQGAERPGAEEAGLRWRAHEGRPAVLERGRGVDRANRGAGNRVGARAAALVEEVIDRLIEQAAAVAAGGFCDPVEFVNLLGRDAEADDAELAHSSGSSRGNTVV